MHIHGGGFIALSPTTHESYLRKWSNELKIPLMSVDYSKAPEYPYPKALDDVYQSYMWNIKYAQEVLNIKLDNIILVGDSAGGNLALALAYLLITLNKPHPSSLFLVYPGIVNILFKL
jgi:hormone-sensitive lipase